MPNSYFYSNTATQTTLSGSISAGATTITVGATTGFPSSFPYILALDYGASTEELVSVTAAAGTNLTITRGFGSTSAQSHSLGAVVRHTYNAVDATDFRTHEAATSDVHGVTGALVGATQTQTLTNKTLTAPTITNPTVTGGGSLAGTFSGTPTFSGALTMSAGASISGGSVTVTRAATTNPALNLQVTGDTNARLLQQADGKLLWGPGNATQDSILFRDGSKQLALSDTLLRVYRAGATDAALSALVTGDPNSRFYYQADGKMFWGPGSATQDTNLYRSAADTLKTDDSFTVGANLSVSGNASITGNLDVTGIGRELHARKTADTSITSNATPSTDPHLTVAVAANSVYEIFGVLFVASASTTPDILWGISGPTGATGTWSSAAPTFGSTADPDSVRTIASDIGNTRSYGIPQTTSSFGMMFSGMIETAGTSGNCFINWSQATSSATATTLKIYSWMRLTKVA